MNNDQISEVFAKGQTTGTANNMFIDGDTIYSYGRHFPIARWYKGVVLFNPDGYSNTTAKHKGKVLYALRGETIVYLNDCDIRKIESQQDTNSREIESLKGKTERARSDHIKTYYMARIEDLKNQNTLLSGLVEGVRE